MSFFDQVNILTHTAEVPYETYPLKEIEETRKKMKEQDLQEFYGVSESSIEHNLSQTSTNSRNVTMDETSKTSCNDSICKDISDGVLYMLSLIFNLIQHSCFHCAGLDTNAVTPIDSEKVMLGINIHLMNLRYKARQPSVPITLAMVVRL